MTDLKRRYEDLKDPSPIYDPFRQILNVAANQGRNRRKDLAKLYRKLSASTNDAYQLFYTGQIAGEIVDTVSIDYCSFDHVIMWQRRSPFRSPKRAV